MGYKPLRYTDVAELLESEVKRNAEMRKMSNEKAALFLTYLIRLPIRPEWVAVARGWVPRA